MEKEFEILDEITLPVEIGDTILVGRFKNKKLVVKDIGVDDKDTNYQWKEGSNSQ